MRNSVESLNKNNRKKDLEDEFINSIKLKISKKNENRVKRERKETNQLILNNQISTTFLTRNINNSNNFLKTEPTNKTKGLSFDKYSNRKNIFINTCSSPILTYIDPYKKENTKIKT